VKNLPPRFRRAGVGAGGAWSGDRDRGLNSLILIGPAGNVLFCFLGMGQARFYFGDVSYAFRPSHDKSQLCVGLLFDNVPTPTAVPPACIVLAIFSTLI
jgi:hypothetical protein